MNLPVAQRIMSRLKASRTRLFPVRAIVFSFSISMMVLIWGAVGFEIEQDRHDARTEWTRNLENLTRAIEEHSVRTVTSVDDNLKLLRNHYLRQGRALDIPKMVSSGELSSSTVNQLGVIDANGTYILSSLPHKSVFLGDREHFKFHLDSVDDNLFVSKPVLGRASGRWSIQLTRKITSADGQFDGVVVASLDPAYFGNLYGDVSLGDHGVITLIGTDGITRARRSDGKLTVGQDISQTPLFRREGTKLNGNYIDLSPIDGIKRLYVFRRVSDYPLIVMVAVTLERVYERSNERRDGYLMIGVLATALTMVFTFLVMRFSNRQEQYLHELKHSRAEAESASKMKSEFLASMSHELRTPLNGILGYSDLVRQLAPDEKLKRFGNSIHTSGRHLLMILNTILDIAKIEAGKMEVNLEETELRVLVDQVAGMHEIAATSKGLAFQVRVDQHLPEFVVCDELLVKQVLNNLMNNAIKFTERGSITLSISRLSDRAIIFSVKDSGIGIPASYLDKVFEKFRQADQSITRAHQGTGLGLNLAKQLVELMGGQIAIASTQDIGTTIAFTLPGKLAPESYGLAVQAPARSALPADVSC